jgi:dipeptidase E
MKLFLSSDDFGDNPQQLVELVGEGGQVALCVNARDNRTVAERHERYQAEEELLRKLGYVVVELDLRGHRDTEDIEQYLKNSKLVWVTGGNSFVLNQRIKESGFDQAIIKLLRSDRIVYGGYSAGAIVAGNNLHGIEHGDDPSLATKVYWDGMSLVDYAIIPHWESDD